jgi:hypothetical protein
MSRRSCEARFFSRSLPAIFCSMVFLISCSLAASARLCSAFSAARLIVLALGLDLALLHLAAVRVRSSPPP